MTREETFYVGAQDIRLDFRFCSQPFLSLTGLQ